MNDFRFSDNVLSVESLEQCRKRKAVERSRDKRSEGQRKRWRAST